VQVEEMEAGWGAVKEVASTDWVEEASEVAPLVGNSEVAKVEVRMGAAKAVLVVLKAVLAEREDSAGGWAEAMGLEVAREVEMAVLEVMAAGAMATVEVVEVAVQEVLTAVLLAVVTAVEVKAVAQVAAMGEVATAVALAELRAAAATAAVRVAMGEVAMAVAFAVGVARAEVAKVAVMVTVVVAKAGVSKAAARVVARAGVASEVAVMEEAMEVVAMVEKQAGDYWEVAAVLEARYRVSLAERLVVAGQEEMARVGTSEGCSEVGPEEVVALAEARVDTLHEVHSPNNRDQWGNSSRPSPRHHRRSHHRSQGSPGRCQTQTRSRCCTTFDVAAVSMGLAGVAAAAEEAVAALMAVVIMVAVEKVVGPVAGPKGWPVDGGAAARRVEMEARTEVSTATVVPTGELTATGEGAMVVVVTVKATQVVAGRAREVDILVAAWMVVALVVAAKAKEAAVMLADWAGKEVAMVAGGVEGDPKAANEEAIAVGVATEEKMVEAG